MPVSQDDICTSRLVLIAVTPELIRYEQTDQRRLAEQIRSTIPESWPPPYWETHVFDYMLSQFEHFPDQLGWPRYIVLNHLDGTRILVGSCGAHSHTDPPVECEIGYSLLPAFEGQGIATEAIKALIEFLRQDPRITSITADTIPSLPGSIRVMEKCGLTFDGPGHETGTVRYRLRLLP
ncbi:GNAT family N-acetyltransferase [Edaphobacter bradus]|uniref:GNAT family N-acetyltransferase n=1 Tax=Edaphobacter bradus TaxID=2259016 RepID=UPI0021E0387C|nr:GNAT family N-acetyltransferase [Edaphobacter bradus]